MGARLEQRRESGEGGEKRERGRGKRRGRQKEEEGGRDWFIFFFWLGTSWFRPDADVSFGNSVFSNLTCGPVLVFRGVGWEEQEREGRLFKGPGAGRTKSGVRRRSGRREAELGRGVLGWGQRSKEGKTRKEISVGWGSGPI